LREYSTALDSRVRQLTDAAEHWNQPPALAGYNAWDIDPVLRSAVTRGGAAWVGSRAAELGALVGSERMQSLAAAANRHVPELRTHDRFGDRIDTVDYHPAYHELMALAFGAGLHSLSWTVREPGAVVGRAALNYLWNQGENGTACPVTMTFAAVQIMRNDAALSAVWEPKLLACDYDPRLLPVGAKRAVTIGMAMTERQGGSDLRATRTVAMPDGGEYRLEGHKWFCSVPMSDGFFTLAKTDAGITCFFVPRVLENGERNAFRINRLKDKCGNRSNASSEIEYHGTRARRIGEDGRGIATLLEMAHLTRFDITLASAGMMRAMLVQALHHARHRQAFSRDLAAQPLMQNVLADLTLEWQAATLLAFRLAAAFDRSATDESQRQLVRVLTPIAKYWLCKRCPAVAVEAMECLGGNGYVEEAPLARLYREAPLNGIWEGSGNVICLDVLRSLTRHPQALDALLSEIRAGGGPLDGVARAMEKQLRGPLNEAGARRLVEATALALQASLMQQHAASSVADAFIASRLGGEGGRQLGTLPPATDFAAVIAAAGLPA
jgi:putative acyl-CoA dehydrogenase